MVSVQADDDAEDAHELLHPCGQEFSGLRVDGLSPEHVDKVVALLRLVWVRNLTPLVHGAGIAHALRLKGEAGRWVSLPATR